MELMVVVSVIAILSAIVYANFGGARAASRDDVRKSALLEVQLALELYKAQNGSYPIPGCGAASGEWAGPDHSEHGCDNYIPGLAPDFIAALPTDPKSEVGNTGFMYRSNGTNYRFITFNAVEVKTVSSDDEFYCSTTANCGGVTGNGANRAKIYSVNSPQAADW